MSTTTAEETNLSGSSAPNVTRPGNLFPDKLDRFLDVVAYNPGGEYIFVGTSSLSTTIWKGSAWLFSDSYLGSASCLKPAPADCLSGIVVETGVSAAVFVDQSKLLFGCDSGALRFNDVRDSQGGGDALKVQLTLLGYSSEHSCTVSDLDVLDLGTTAVSCSQDCSIKVWDVASLVSEHTFSPAHVNPVTGVRRQPNSSHTFASTSLDGTALFWDIRQSKPATSLYAPGVGLTAVTWSSAEKVVLGSVSGEVVSVDIRKASEPGGSFKAVHRPVHRLQACPDDPSLIAVCQDSSTFTVIKCEDTVIRSVYQDDRHGDFVRCATWHPTNKALLTCSWDSTISSHPISGLQLNGFGKQDKSS